MTIRSKRLNQGLGLKEFAQKCGVDAGNLSRIERGEAGASMATLRKIAVALDVAIGEIAVIP